MTLFFYLIKIKKKACLTCFILVLQIKAKITEAVNQATEAQWLNQGLSMLSLIFPG